MDKSLESNIHLQKNIQQWQGKAVIGEGYGVFLGTAGHSRFHKHWADQCTIGLGENVSVYIEDNFFSDEVVIIPANTRHQLLSANVLSIYVEPFSVYANFYTQLLKAKNLSNKAAFTCKQSDLPEYIQNNLEFSNIDAISNAIVDVAKQECRPESQRIIDLKQYLFSEITAGNTLSRDKAASLLGLSKSHFSHWFKDSMGISFSSYRKWLKLCLSINAMLNGETLANAATTGGFSDQAHLSRTFSLAFGHTIGDVVQALSIQS